MNHSTIDSAIVAPTPSISANSAAEAAAILFIDPNVVASACAAVGPTWRIESATITRQSGRDFASSSAANNFSTFLPASPSFLVKKADFINFSSLSEKRSDSSSITPSAKRATAASYPKTSISSAAREPM